jgi:hypothetical protein
MFHNFISSTKSLRLGQLAFHSSFLAENFSPVGLTDSNSLLAERYEYVEVSGG